MSDTVCVERHRSGVRCQKARGHADWHVYVGSNGTQVWDLFRGKP